MSMHDLSLFFFGFIDDFYILLVPIAGQNNFAVQIQSESRLGSGDFGANYQRVSKFVNEMKINQFIED